MITWDSRRFGIMVWVWCGCCVVVVYGILVGRRDDRVGSRKGQEEVMST